MLQSRRACQTNIEKGYSQRWEKEVEESGEYPVDMENCQSHLNCIRVSMENKFTQVRNYS